MTSTRLADREGRLGLDDMACHVPVAFDVPAGTEALHIRFDHSPRHPGAGDIPHQLSISVTGPKGDRGTRHNHADQTVLLSEHHASPGYLRGRPEPGRWRVEIDVHRILPPGGVGWTLTVDAVPPPPAPERSPAHAGAPDSGGAGWYRGDLHRHTDHSDARWSPAEMVAEARARGYDFAALTDHNTVSALGEARAAAGPDLLILPGMEMTTFHGHALVLGSGRTWDWRIRDGQTMGERAQDIHAAGDLFLIAHPMDLGHPFCTGCTWAWADMMPGPARMVEVWNGPWGGSPKNPLALDLFHGWLNRGHRLVATASSDDHGGFAAGTALGHMLVHAGGLTVPDLLDGLRGGHAVLTSGPRLGVSGRSSTGGAVLPGDHVTGPVDLDIDWSDGPKDGRLCIVGGRVGDSTVVRLDDRHAAPNGAFRLAAGAGRGCDWIMVELRDQEGDMVAMSNPIFLGDPGPDRDDPGAIRREPAQH